MIRLVSTSRAALAVPALALLFVPALASKGLSAGGGTVEGYVPFVTASSGTTNLGSTAQVSYLEAYNQATVNFLAPTVSWARFYDQSIADVRPGSEISWLLMHGESTANINRSRISWVKLFGSSRAHLHDSADVSWVLLNQQAQAHFYGREFRYSGGSLSGKWADGTPFSFWALNEADLMSGNITSTMPSGLRLHTVPEPGAWLVGGVGLIGAWRLRRRRLSA